MVHTCIGGPSQATLQLLLYFPSSHWVLLKVMQPKQPRPFHRGQNVISFCHQLRQFLLGTVTREVKVLFPLWLLAEDCLSYATYESSRSYSQKSIIQTFKGIYIFRDVWFKSNLRKTYIEKKTSQSSKDQKLIVHYWFSLTTAVTIFSPNF